jgi:hypothetical protein
MSPLADWTDENRVYATTINIGEVHRNRRLDEIRPMKI